MDRTPPVAPRTSLPPPPPPPPLLLPLPLPLPLLLLLLPPLLFFIRCQAYSPKISYRITPYE